MGSFGLVGRLLKNSPPAVKRLVAQAEQNILKLLGRIWHDSLLHRCLGNKVLQLSGFKSTQKGGNVLPGMVLGQIQALTDNLANPRVLNPLQLQVAEGEGDELFVYQE